MNVVFGSTSGEQREALSASKTACVCPQALRVANKIGSVFGAENAMNEIANVRVGHLSKSIRNQKTLAVTYGTTLCRPSGTLPGDVSWPHR